MSRKTSRGFDRREITALVFGVTLGIELFLWGRPILNTHVPIDDLRLFVGYLLTCLLAGVLAERRARVGLSGRCLLLVTLPVILAWMALFTGVSPRGSLPVEIATVAGLVPMAFLALLGYLASWIVCQAASVRVPDIARIASMRGKRMAICCFILVPAVVVVIHPGELAAPEVTIWAILGLMLFGPTELPKLAHRLRQWFRGTTWP